MIPLSPGATGADELRQAIDEPVVLVDHDPHWSMSFEAERRRLVEALPGLFVEIAHIGSTAVPDIRTKPLIDLLAGVPSLADAFALNHLLDRIGYTTLASYNAALTTRQWFMRQSGGHRTHHLHAVVHDGPEWRARIGFRDALLADAVLRARYQSLKEDLLARHPGDRDAYTEGKSAFIASVQGRWQRPPA